MTTILIQTEGWAGTVAELKKAVCHRDALRLKIINQTSSMCAYAVIIAGQPILLLAVIYPLSIRAEI